MALLDLRIICIGNFLHGNDGMGHAVFERLQKITLPNNVELFEGGIGGLTLLPFFKDTQRVLLIDLMISNHEVGHIFCYPDVIANLPVKANQSGEHGGDLTTLLTMLPIYLDAVPKVDLLCVSAATVSCFTHALDSQIAKVLDDVCMRIHRYINNPLVIRH
jgi:hydrogenase maturation protease